MLLYHFTSTVHLSRIESCGYLDVTESNLSGRIAHAGPDVVWLTDAAEPDRFGDGLTGSAVDKTDIRITVDVPDAQPWLAWSRRHGITKKWATVVEDGRRPERWFVVTHRIPRGQWLAVEVQAVAA